MGDPRKTRKKYQKPSHPWQKERIEEEKIIFKEFGMRNKKEIWRMNSILKNFKEQTKKLIAATSSQAEKEKMQLLKKTQNMGMISKSAKMEDILSLSLNDILNRRLQTIVFKNGLARTVDQSRQFVVHGHIKVNNKKISSPSYIVLKSEEDKISFSPSSKLSKEDHPERIIEKTEPKKEEKVMKKRKNVRKGLKDEKK